MKRSRRVVLTMMGTAAVGAVSMGFVRPGDCGPYGRPGPDGRWPDNCRVRYGGFCGGGFPGPGGHRPGDGRPPAASATAVLAAADSAFRVVTAMDMAATAVAASVVEKSCGGSIVP